MRFFIASRPLRTALRWQGAATVAAAAIAGAWGGAASAASALLGGLVNVIAGLVFALMVSDSKVKSAGAVMRVMLRAEASKIVLIVLQLWLVLTAYEGLVAAPFFATFVLAVVVSQAAILVRD